MALKSASGPQQGSRLGNRLKLGYSATVVLPHETRKCLLDDVSTRGARIRIEPMLEKGRTAKLCFHELRIFATVAWARNGECGLRFDRPLPQEDMEGFLWITLHPTDYERICRESGAQDWATGLGG